MPDAACCVPSKSYSQHTARNTQHTALLMRDEFQFINRLRQKQHTAHRTPHTALSLGIGDDAAIFRFSDRNASTVITTDLLVEDIDFRRAWLPLPKLAHCLGHKSLAVSLSDIAAMGARPHFALTSIGVPKNIWRTKFLDEFYASFHALADKFNITLIGGELGAIVTAIALSRQTVTTIKQGLFTGALGGAAAGLKLLESGARFNHRRMNAKDELILRQLYPTPRLETSTQVSSNSMIDLSDGLSSDLAHICRESKVGARVYADKIPLDPALEKIGVTKRDALTLALDGGEDFELLFTCHPSTAAQIPAHIGDIPITHIGEITNDAGQIVLLNNGRARCLKPRGFIHFR
ncbi:MAG: thiamine-phosphate kinase [Pyrinomonadaceae bacterium]